VVEVLELEELEDSGALVDDSGALVDDSGALVDVSGAVCVSELVGLLDGQFASFGAHSDELEEPVVSPAADESLLELESEVEVALDVESASAERMVPELELVVASASASVC